MTFLPVNLSASLLYQVWINEWISLPSLTFFCMRLCEESLCSLLFSGSLDHGHSAAREGMMSRMKRSIGRIDKDIQDTTISSSFSGCSAGFLETDEQKERKGKWERERKREREWVPLKSLRMIKYPSGYICQKLLEEALRRKCSA